jgi:hypothetical protein
VRFRIYWIFRGYHPAAFGKGQNAEIGGWLCTSGRVVRISECAMTGKSDDNQRDEVLRRMLKTPPKPHKPIGKGKKRDQSQKQPSTKKPGKSGDQS